MDCLLVLLVGDVSLNETVREIVPDLAKSVTDLNCSNSQRASSHPTMVQGARVNPVSCATGQHGAHSGPRSGPDPRGGDVAGGDAATAPRGTAAATTPGEGLGAQRGHNGASHPPHGSEGSEVEGHRYGIHVNRGSNPAEGHARDSRSAAAADAPARRSATASTSLPAEGEANQVLVPW